MRLGVVNDRTNRQGTSGRQPPVLVEMALTGAKGVLLPHLIADLRTSLEALADQKDRQIARYGDPRQSMEGRR
jgi:hypothetical protein